MKVYVVYYEDDPDDGGGTDIRGVLSSEDAVHEFNQLSHYSCEIKEFELDELLNAYRRINE